MNAQWLLSWWNLVFLLPFGLAAVYLGVYALTGITFGDADADVDHDYDHDIGHDVDHDVDHDFDADADADVDADAEVEADADVDADADADADADGHDAEAAHGGSVSLPMAVLTWFGVGRVPLSILFMVLLFTWGGVGFVINSSLRERMGETWRVAAYSLPAAAIAGVVVTHLVSRMITRFIPLNETYARRRHDLLGEVGEAIFDITTEFGMVSVRDDGGNLYHVPCRLAAGSAGEATDAVPKGSKVKLVAYNGKLKLFSVIPEPAPSAPGSQGSRGPDGAKAVA